jgi:glutathione S-transferase
MEKKDPEWLVVVDDMEQIFMLNPIPYYYYLSYLSRRSGKAIDKSISSSLNDTMDSGSWFKPGCDSTITVRFNDDQSTPRFGTAYWNIRGLGAPIRMMLCAAKLNFNVYLYDVLEDGEHSWKASYYADKATNLVPNYTPFMNLPCLVDEQEKVVVTQTNACMHYIGNVCGMMGQNPLEQSVCVQFLSEIYDLRTAMTDFAYGKPDSAAESAISSGKTHFAKFEQHFKNKEMKCFTVGNSMTAPDFHLFEMIDQFDLLCKTTGSTDLLAEYPNVRSFYTEFSQLEYVRFPT